MHIAKLIRRRFPNQSRGVLALLGLVSASALLVGLRLLLLSGGA
jgi:hypothetical protein